MIACHALSEGSRYSVSANAIFKDGEMICHWSQQARGESIQILFCATEQASMATHLDAMRKDAIRHPEAEYVQTANGKQDVLEFVIEAIADRINDDEAMGALRGNI